MRLRVSFLLVLACMLGMSTAVWARTISANLEVSQSTKLMNVELKPGQYRLVANESTGEVQVVCQHKVVAKVKGQWVKLSQKAEYTAVLTTDHSIKEINFAGKDKAIKF